jgi:PKD repeat protein
LNEIIMNQKTTHTAFFTLIICLLIPIYQVSLNVSDESGLVRNGDFETGSANPWEGISDENIVSDPAYSGKFAVRITQGDASQGIAVIPGQTYLLTAWYRWEIFEGNDWGYDRITIINQDWSEAAGLTKMHRSYEKGMWHKLAIAFTAESPTIRITFGMFGPQERVEMYFDDFQLIEKHGNLPPVAKAAADITRGEVPFRVRFTANSYDEDGAVESHYWDFRDGSISTAENPQHTFMSPGTYVVKLTVRDNEGVAAISYRTIYVTDPNGPLINVEAVRLQASEADGRAITLSGQVQVQSGSEIVGLVWDHVTNHLAGSIEISPAAMVNWTTPQIPLKPGKNEILLTAVDDLGHVSTEKIILHRPLTRPKVSDIEISSQEVGLYEKFEVSFQLATVADNYFFRYDPTPPAGVPVGSGVSVTGIFHTPSGLQLEQPAFYNQEAVSVACGEAKCFQQTGQNVWMLRFAPQEIGDYQVELRVEDASGTTTVPIDGFRAIESSSKGFVQVSRADPRYFEFSNGDIFWPMGPANGEDYASYNGTGQNMERPWMAGIGAYSTNFARWISSEKEMGNEGFDSNLVFTERYPGHELSQVLAYPDANRIWIGWSSGQRFRPLFTPGTEYQIMLRLKITDISGPVDPDYPFGMMIKTHGWPSENFETDMRKHPSLIPPVSDNADWHTIVTRYTAQERDFGNGNLIYLSLYLDNVSAGDVYIDHFSIREVQPDGSLGREIMINRSADLHAYVEPAPAAYFDWQVSQGELNGVYFKYVVHDKRDWIQNHLNQHGMFVENGDGYYQKIDTKARWLLEQWWRYLIARWGYSTAIHSWELNNEGPPNDSRHFQMAQDFARYMHENDAHPHLATTSFWSDWIPAFWTNRIKYPDLDYANIHEYIKDPEAAYDVAGWLIASSQKVFESQVVIPVMKGETGIGGPSDEHFKLLSEPNSGVWYHNLLWAQLSSGPIYNPNYWWSEHLKQIDRNQISRSFQAFISGLDLNRGGYVHIGAESSNPSLRIVGQKNLQSNKAHLWVQNSKHTWRNVMGIHNPETVTPLSGQVVIKMMPNTGYTIEYWDTYAGVVEKVEQIKSDNSGNISLSIEALSSDLAVKIQAEER